MTSESRFAAPAESWFRVGEVEPGVHLVAEPGHVNSWLIGGEERSLLPTRLLVDGERLDLGGRELTVIHTPGHAPDHICLLDERAGVLWAQDQAYYGPHLVYEPGADLDQFATSARHLAEELAGALRTVYCAHCLRPSVPPSFLAELADAAESVAGGEVATEPAAGFFGEPVRAADFGHFSIMVPR